MENSGEQTKEASEDFKLIFERIVNHIPSWKQSLRSVEDLYIKRLSGLSNACFRVTIKDEIIKNTISVEPKTLLYRWFEQELTDKRIEQAIFETKSGDGTGPKLYFQNLTYRIEGYFDGRPITIWEMRNPLIFTRVAEMIVDYNFDPLANQRIQEINPKDKKNLFIHQVIK